jgi:hypothetical protein
MQDVPLDEHLVADLTVRYHDRLPDDQIEAVVSDSWRSITAEARFDTYLGVLTRRLADERLRSMARTEPDG